MSSNNDQPDDDVSRRDFLKGAGVAGVVGATGATIAEQGLNNLELVDDPIGSYAYRDWEDFYREEWDWDSV
ncbi:MAG: twin-arginine translocation signal domain-containing protein, partial [Halapricum sp.]